MQTRVPALDGLRGIAVILVVLTHFQVYVVLPGNIFGKLFQRLMATGWLGVDIFFVLSGFLITRILLNEPTGAKRFYRNRAFRILPAFFVVFAAALIVFPTSRVPLALLYLFFLGDFGILFHGGIACFAHLWSLAVEEQFYLIWPQIAWRTPRATVLKIAVSIAVTSALLRIVLALFRVEDMAYWMWGVRFEAILLCCAVAVALGLLAAKPWLAGFSKIDARTSAKWLALAPFILYWVMLKRVDGLALGCAVAAALGIPAAKQWLTRWWSFMAKASAGFLFVGFLALKLSFFSTDAWAQVIAIPGVSVLTACLVFAAAENLSSVRLNSFLCNRVLVYFGKRSYGLYLIHWPIFVFLSTWPTDVLLRITHVRERILIFVVMVAGAVVSVGLAELSWRLIEQPAQSLKKRLFDARPTCIETVA